MAVRTAGSLPWCSSFFRAPPTFTVAESRGHPACRWGHWGGWTLFPWWRKDARKGVWDSAGIHPLPWGQLWQQSLSEDTARDSGVCLKALVFKEKSGCCTDLPLPFQSAAGGIFSHFLWLPWQMFKDWDVKVTMYMSEFRKNSPHRPEDSTDSEKTQESLKLFPRVNPWSGDKLRH